MREIRTSGSEGGGVEPNRLSLPLSEGRIRRLQPPVQARGRLWVPAFRGGDENERGSHSSG